MNSQIYDEASEWLVELQTEETDARTHERFAAWLDTSPEHVRAFLEVTSLWEDASDIDRRRKLDVDALIASAKAERNLYPLEVSSGRSSEAGVGHGPWARADVSRSGRRWFALAASIAALMISAAGAGYWATQLRGVYSTKVGEQRTLALADGTTVELNAGTRIREHYTDAERAVDLLQGQALFRVTKDATRPFVVRSDTATVRAIGTQFDVHRRATGTTVTVLEGKVAVASIVELKMAPITKARKDGAEKIRHKAASGQVKSQRASREGTEILLGAGEQVNLGDDGDTAVPKSADVRAATAWTQQRLVFELANLSDAAEEFNRFNKRKLIIDPKGLEDFKVSGTFEALDPESLQRFVHFLRDQGLSVVEDDHSVRIAKNR